MRNPLRILDSWASQSGDRAALVLWVAILTVVMLTLLAIGGVIWYTEPASRAK